VGISRREDTEEFNCPCGTLQTIQHILKKCVLKHAGTFLERFLQHWRNESCWGPREASRLWRNSWPSSREIFLYGFGSWLHLVGVQGSFPFHHLSITGVDSGWRIVLFSGHWALFVNSILVRWNFVNDDIDVKYCPFGALNKWYLCYVMCQLHIGCLAIHRDRRSYY
jgi:hypothetical protein